MKTKKYISAFLATLMLCLATSVFAVAENEVFTVAFTDGLGLINPLTGKAPTDIFTGEPMTPIKVNAGESFVFPENTIIFRDYVFSGWKYTYLDENEKKQTKIFSPGDTFENVTSNLEFGAYWKRPDPIEIEISGYLRFVSTESYVEGTVPETMVVVYKSEITLPTATLEKDGYDFVGWIDSDSNFYENGGIYTVNKINPVLTAVWQPDGTAVLTHKVIYDAGTENAVGSCPRPLEMYKKDTFTAAECTLTYEGYRFLCWQDEDGNEYIPGNEYTVETEMLSLSAKWEKIIRYYTLSVAHNYGGILMPDGESAFAENDTVTVYATPLDGYYIASFKLNGVEMLADDDSKFGMGAAVADMTGDVNVIVKFVEMTVPEILLNITGGGKIIPENAPKGKYAFSLLPDEGHLIDGLTVSGAAFTLDNGIYTLESFDGDVVTITAIFVPEVPEQSEAETTSEAPVHREDEDAFYLVMLGIIVVGMIAFTVIYTAKMRR